MKAINNDFSSFVDSYKNPTIQITSGKKATKYVKDPEVPTLEGNTTETVTTKPITQGTDRQLDWSNDSDMVKILDAQQYFESNYDPYAESNKHRPDEYRAKGISQVMDKTWQEGKDRGWIAQDASQYDPDASSRFQNKYMRHIYKQPYIQSSPTENGKTRRTLAAYNVGIGNVQKAVNAANAAGEPTKWMDYLSAAGSAKHKEVSEYVPKIMNRILASGDNFVANRKWDFKLKTGGILYKRS